MFTAKFCVKNPYKIKKMKYNKFFKISLCLLITSTSLMAQGQKGVSLLEGSLSFLGIDSKQKAGSIDGDHNDSKRISISPKIGFFTSESLLLGVGLTYQYSSFESEFPSYYLWDGNYSFVSVSETTNIFYVTPYLTKFRKIKDQLYFTTTLNLELGYGEKDTGESTDLNESYILDFGIGLTPGITYFISDKWALKTSLGELYYKHTVETQSDRSPDLKNINNNYGLNFRLNTFTIGFQYVMGKKSKEEE